jgi:putative ABC transport system substrate-binding protein
MRQGLRDLGYVEGQTIALDVRFAGDNPEAFPSLAADLVRRKVDLIFASGPAAIRAAADATRRFRSSRSTWRAIALRLGCPHPGAARWTSRAASSINPV